MTHVPNEYRSTTYDDRADDVRAPQWEEAVAAGALVPAEPARADAPLAADHVDGNLRRYARWQWKDFWQHRGFWMAAAALFGVWLLTYIPTMPRRSGPMTEREVTTLACGLFAVGGVLAGLLGTGGLVSRERERGLQRFLFAKPVAVVRYYLQALAVNGAGSLVVIAGAVLLAAFLLGPAVPVLGVFAIAAAAYAFSSGATFLVSTLLRFDAPLVGFWLVLGFPAFGIATATKLWWAHALSWLFPQAPIVAVLRAAGLELSETLSAPEMVRAVLAAGLLGSVYGIVAVLLGVLVLRRRSIST